MLLLKMRKVSFEKEPKTLLLLKMRNFPNWMAQATNWRHPRLVATEGCGTTGNGVLGRKSSENTAIAQNAQSFLKKEPKPLLLLKMRKKPKFLVQATDPACRCFDVAVARTRNLFFFAHFEK